MADRNSKHKFCDCQEVLAKIRLLVFQKAIRYLVLYASYQQGV